MMNGISNSGQQQLNHLQNQSAHLIQTSSASCQVQRVPQQNSAHTWYTTDGRIESGNRPPSSNMLQCQKTHLNQLQHNGMNLTDLSINTRLISSNRILANATNEKILF